MWENVCLGLCTFSRHTKINGQQKKLLSQEKNMLDINKISTIALYAGKGTIRQALRRDDRKKKLK